MRRAVVLGAWNYSAGALHAAEHDAKEFAELLGSLGFDEVRLVLDDPAVEPNRVSHTRIVRELNDLVAGTQEGDTIVFYFSGHGVELSDKNEDERLSDPRDRFDEALLGSNGVAVRDDHIWTALKPLQAVPRAQGYLIVDACHSGTINKITFEALDRTPAWIKSLDGEFVAYGVEAEVPARESLPSDWVVLAAAEDSQVAVALEGGSLFTRALVDSISGHRSRPLADSFQEARSRVEAEARALGYRQSPRLAPAGHAAFSRVPF